jgi:hypothetical protein
LSGKKLTQDLVDGYQLSKLLLQGWDESELNFHELGECIVTRVTIFWGKTLQNSYFFKNKQ